MAADQIEVAGATFVPICVKVDGSLLERALAGIQFAMAKTVPTNAPWPHLLSPRTGVPRGSEKLH